MNYYRINTDQEARKDLKTCDLWYEYEMAFAGDNYGEEGKHKGFFKRVKPGDRVFMHQSNEGIVGLGEVEEQWDKITYTGKERLLYVKEPFEYRIKINWLPEYDRRANPLPISGRLHYAKNYSVVDPDERDIPGVIKSLKIK